MVLRNSTPDSQHSHSRGYPLIALFLLLAVAASLAAQLALVRHATFSAPELIWESAAFATAGALLGIAVGLHHYRRIQGGIAGFFVGIVIGAMAGPMAKLADEEPLSVIATATGCGVMLIVFTSAYQFGRRRPTKADQGRPFE